MIGELPMWRINFPLAVIRHPGSIIAYVSRGTPFVFICAALSYFEKRRPGADFASNMVPFLPIRRFILSLFI